MNYQIIIITQKQPERVTPPQTNTITMYITPKTTRNIIILIFQFYQIIAFFIVFVEVRMSRDREDIV
jgi:hypothetical protein